jgi:hypothetical protein
MKAFVTSIGEPTTDLCVWSLERNGFEVVLLNNGSLLVDKLKTIYEQADDDFVRIDGDVVVNKKFTPHFIKGEMWPDIWWLQFITYDWLKQNLTYGGAQMITAKALPALRANVDRVHNLDRPETALSRIEEFYNPRRFESCEAVVGLHGFALGDHLERVDRQKQKRDYFNTYDFELLTKLEGLLK